MSDHGQGAFSGWPQEKRAEFIGRLLGIIKATDLGGVAVALTLDEASGTAPKHTEYLICAYFTMILLAKLVEDRPLGDRVAYTFDERQKVIGDLATLNLRMRKSRSPLARRIGPAHSESSHEYPALQAADLLAYAGHAKRLEELDMRTPASNLAIWETLMPKIRFAQAIRWEPEALHLAGFLFAQPSLEEERDIVQFCAKYVVKPQATSSRFPDAEVIRADDVADWIRTHGKMSELSDDS